MTYTLNDGPLDHCVIIAPYFGVWTAMVSVIDTAPAVGDAATIVLGEATWIGTVTDASLDGSITRVTVIGGAAKLADEIPARQWAGKHLHSSIANAVCVAAGEVLDVAPVGDAVDFGHSIETAGHVLDAISERIDVPWRVTAAGLVTFSATGVVPDGTVTDSDLDGSIIYDVDNAIAEPFPLQLVEHEYTGSEVVTTVRQWRTDRGRQLRRVYEGELASQSGSRVVIDCGTSGTFECNLWHGLQGVSATLATGSSMLVIQLSAERFIAIGHPDGSAVPTELSIDAVSILLGAGDRTVIRNGDLVGPLTVPGPIVLTEPLINQSKVKA